MRPQKKKLNPENAEIKPPLSGLETLKKALKKGTYPANVNTSELRRLVKILSSPRLQTKEKGMFTCLMPDWKNVLSELEQMINKNTKIYKQIQFVKKDTMRAPIIAVENGYSDLIALFVKHDFEMEAVFKPFNRTILLHAVDNGQITLVYFLLTQGANIKAIDENEHSCLHIATSNGDKLMIKLLLSQSVMLLSRSVMLNPRSQSEMLKMLFPSDKAGKTPLHYAIENSNINIVKLLVSHGADVHAKDSENKSLLHEAAMQSNEEAMQSNAEIIDILLEEGLDIDARDSSGHTPLHLAVLWNCLESTKLLLERGANKHLKNCKQETPLYCAIKNNYVNIVNLLLDYGVDIEDNSLYNRGTSIFHWAARVGDINLFSKLLKKPGSYYTIDSNGMNPADIAHLAGNYELLDEINRYAKKEMAGKNWMPVDIIIIIDDLE